MPMGIPPSWSNLTGKPTTRAGYGITDAAPLDGNGGVGSYGFFTWTTASTVNVGATSAGSGLKWAGTDGTDTASPSGTWRCLGYVGTSGGKTIWQRIL